MKRVTQPAPPTLDIAWVAPADLVPDPANPRSMDAAEDAKLDRSLTELGFRLPILARKNDHVVIDGHQRLRAAIRLGLASIPVLFVDDLDHAQARLLNLAVNHIHGDWDNGMNRLPGVLEDLGQPGAVVPRAAGTDFAELVHLGRGTQP